MADPSFVPALLVVDMQEDFCPPNGSLAVPSGRTITPLINSLLASRHFVLRIATKDFHPPNHISFASQHTAPHNVPFVSNVTIRNPLDPSKTMESRLWPDHCVQGTPGAELIPELDVSLVDEVVVKGGDARVEMYSVFQDPFGCNKTRVAALLKTKGVTHVYVVGLAADYCVKYTALDSQREGFETLVVSDATKGVDESGLGDCWKDMEEKGVRVVTSNSEEVTRVLME